MSEINRILRVSIDPTKNPVGFLNQLNQAFSQACDLFDQQSGFRGTPTFHADLDANSQKIANVADGTEDGDAANLGQIESTVADLGVDHGSVTVTGAAQPVNTIPIADGQGAFWHYTAKWIDGSTENMRSGAVLAVWDTSGNIEQIEFKTQSTAGNLGTTTDLGLAVALKTYEGAKTIELQATSTNEYTISYWRVVF